MKRINNFKINSTMIKKYLPYCFIVLLSCLSIILLDDLYMKGIYTIIITLGIAPFYIGLSNSMHYLKQGLGKTRKQAMEEYISSLIKCVSLSLIFLVFLILFSFIVYKKLYLGYMEMIYKTMTIYMFSLLFSGLGMLIGNMYKKPYIIWILSIIVIILCALFVFLFIIQHYIVCIIVSFILCISVFIFNKLTLKHALF